MRNNIILIFLFSFTILFGQTNERDNNLPADTCLKISKQVQYNSISGTRHSNPLIIANDIVVRGQELDTTLIESISVLKCPEAFYKYHYAGVNGAIICKIKQKFKTVTPISIAKKKSIKGKVIYALNDFYLTDSTLQISVKAIKLIEIINTKGISGINPNSTVINIWTLTEEERKPLPVNCRGVVFSKLKED